MPQHFYPFTQEHFIAVGVGITVGVIIISVGKFSRFKKWTTAILVFLNLSAYPLGQMAWLSVDEVQSIDNIVPLHLCDIAAMIAGFALLTKRPILCSLTYFWGLTATTQAILTPALTLGPAHWPFFSFFLHHFAIVTAALYLPIVEGWRPKQPFWKGPLEANAWILIYLAVAMTANHLLASNFAFASHPPDNPSLIDHLGSWPWYLVMMQTIALVFFFLLALPFVKKAQKYS